MSAKQTVSAIGGMMVVGVGAGTALGVAMENLPIGLALGAALGLLIGAGIDINRRRNSKDPGE